MEKALREAWGGRLTDRARAPHRSPRATSPAVVSKILYLRQNYHFAAYRIAAHLQRFHQVEIARSTVHRILVKNGMGRLPANQKHQPHRERWKRYEKAQPGTVYKVQRSHRIDEQEFYQMIDQNGILDDIHLFNAKLHEWENYYNYHRPHGALQGRTPYERLVEKISS